MGKLENEHKMKKILDRYFLCFNKKEVTYYREFDGSKSTMDLIITSLELPELE